MGERRDKFAKVSKPNKIYDPAHKMLFGSPKARNFFKLYQEHHQDRDNRDRSNQYSSLPVAAADSETYLNSSLPRPNDFTNAHTHLLIKEGSTPKPASMKVTNKQLTAAFKPLPLVNTTKLNPM